MILEMLESFTNVPKFWLFHYVSEDYMQTAVDFLRDLDEFQRLLSTHNSRVESYYDLLEDSIDEQDLRWQHLQEILQTLELKPSKENLLALITRLVSMRDDSMIQVLKKAGRDPESIELSRHQAYAWVSEFYIKRQTELLQQLEDLNLLNPFYRAVLNGIHLTGIAFTKWQPVWTQQILNSVNKKLSEEFNGDLKSVSEFLNREGLIDNGHGGNPGDRCYSVLVRQGDKWVSKAYSEAFPEEVRAVTLALRNFHDSLDLLEDSIFNEKQAWQNYLLALVYAFEETNVHNLIKKWADVDRLWMQIRGPIQPGHPLEYYEDHFRQAVALEWDVRMANPEHSTKGLRKRKIEQMSLKFFNSFENQNTDFNETVDFAVKKLNSVQLHIGRVGLFYGADFCGLPSAQVVPNDEVVSKVHGKKIFAFPDNILQILRSRPFLRLSREVFGQDFMREERQVVFKDRLLWFKLYDISTIGHEYGHILWVADDTEAIMNKTGNYKNVEEWKATTGGLMAFFMDDEDEALDPNLRLKIIRDVVKRSVGLIAWRETSEVLPYYMEALIHLQGLFDTGILDFDNEKKKLKIKIDDDHYQKLKQWYFKAYKDLVFNYYLPKIDPTTFLERFTIKEGSIHMPINEKINAMTKWYWDLYQKYGRELDNMDNKDNYRPFDDREQAA